MAEYITCGFSDGIGRIRLNRPETRNALTTEMLDELRDGVRLLSSKNALRVLVLQAADPVFCAGMDLTQMQDRAKRPDQEALWQRDSEAYHDALVALLDCPVPTVAAVSGPTIAGGVGLATACDVIIAVDSAFFALPEPRRGLVAAMVTPLLLRRISCAKAGYLLLSGKQVSATHALTMGLCDEVTSRTEFDTAVQTMIDSILQSSPQALAATKRFLQSTADVDLKEALRQAIDVSARARSTADATEGLTAFLEKRQPSWTQTDNTA